MRSPLSIVLAVVATLGATVPVLAQTTVYKAVDDNGNVTFSDKPIPGGEKVEIAPVQTFPAPPPSPGSAGGQAARGGKSAPAAFYRAFTIVSPTDDEAVRSNAGDLTVGLRIEPDLREGDAVEILIDGEQAGAPSRSTVQTLNNVERGTHQLRARIVDGAGKEVAAAGPVTFHLLRVAIRAQPRS